MWMYFEKIRKKMTKERLALAFAVAVFLSVFIYVCPVQTPVPGAGTALSQAEFARRYGAEPLSAESNAAAGEDAAITITFAAVRGTHLTLGASVSVGNAHKTLSASGTLYNSIKTQHGVNSIVGALQDGMGNYDVLHFEIYNDTTEDAFYSSETWRGRPHLKLYLLDKSDDSILLFETAIPETLQNITVEGEEKALDMYNGGWFLRFLPYEITIEEKENGEVFSGSGWCRYFMPAVSIRSTLNGVSYVFTSNASVEFHLSSFVCDGWWEFRFKNDVCALTVDGTEYASGGGWVGYSDISLDVSAGQNTEIYSMLWSVESSCFLKKRDFDAKDSAPQKVNCMTTASAQKGKAFEPENVAMHTDMESGYLLLYGNQRYIVKLDVSYGSFHNASAPSSVSTYGVVRFSGNYGLMNYTSTAVTYSYKGSFDSGNLQCSYVVKNVTA